MQEQDPLVQELLKRNQTLAQMAPQEQALPQAPPQQAQGFLSKLFGRKPAPPAPRMTDIQLPNETGTIDPRIMELLMRRGPR